MLRLAVLHSLPKRHQTYLFEEVRKLCNGYIRRNQIPAREVTPLELVSEVWKKLLGSVSLEPDHMPIVRPADWTTDADAPERDERVLWLIAEIGGSRAIGHRYEDIQRERFGRERHYVQPGNDEPEEEGVDPDGPGELQKTDGRRIWQGLLATAAVDFVPGDDVSALLGLLAHDPGILDDAPNGQWPVGLIVARLNDRPTSDSWNEDRVDNAKRRLLNWIARLRKRNQMDATDLEGLFAKVSRQQEARQQKTPVHETRSNPAGLN